MLILFFPPGCRLALLVPVANRRAPRMPWSAPSERQNGGRGRYLFAHRSKRERGLGLEGKEGKALFYRMFNSLKEAKRHFSSINA